MSEALTRKESPRVQRLREIAKDYVTAFPGWSLYRDDFFFGLWRSSGPIRQNIWFGVMSDGEYRLSHDVTAFIPHLKTIEDQVPWVGMLAQFLSIRDGLQSISPSRHASRWRDAVSAMEREFKPDLREPLNLAEVAEMCVAETLGYWDENNLPMLAILNASIGRTDEARQCCIRLQSLESPDDAEMLDWGRAMKAFGLDLLKAIEAGQERQFLEPIVRDAATETGDA
jgi:hypothetical protein